MAGVIDKYAAGMFKRQEQYAQRVKGLYDIAVGKLTALAAQIPYDPDHEFSFSDNPRIADETTRIIRELYSQVYNQIKSGVEAEWNLANLSCDALITSIFGAKIKETNLGAQWFARNQKAMDAFFARKSANEGLNLSQKVWKYTGDLRTELENAISVSLGEGVSAATMSRRVRQYLREPDKLFRRVKGKDGKLHLSKAAKAYHPSRGVYRSSYKNAMRLTRTETNMAYRMADEDRWQRMDFVVGYEVKTSNNHPVPDICDDLKGKYPKGFVFKGWHPQCRCRIVPILATKGEFINLQKIAISGGDARGFVSKNHVASVPSGFTKWIKKNEKRILAAKSKPYFIRDNFIGGDIRNGLTNAVLKAGLMPKNGQLPTIKNVKIEPTASDDRKRLMEQARQAMAGIDVNDALQKRIEAAQALQNSEDGELFIKAYNRLIAGIETQKKWDALVWQGITPEQKANLKELEKALGIKKGRPMTHEQADSGMVNPLFDNPANYGKKSYKFTKSGRVVKNPEWDDQYSVNCQTCVPVYQLRRWGFNIEAMGNPKGRVWGKEILDHDFTKVWMNKKGEYGYGRRFRKTPLKEGNLYLELEAEPDGIYQIECVWKGAKSGHTWVYVKRDGKGFMYDPQSNVRYSDWDAFRKGIANHVSPKYGYSYFRIDDLRVNVDALKQMVKEAEQRKPSVQEIADKRHARRDVYGIKLAWRKRLQERLLAQVKPEWTTSKDFAHRLELLDKAVNNKQAIPTKLFERVYNEAKSGVQTMAALERRAAEMAKWQAEADNVLKFKGKYIEVDTTKLESLMKYRMHKASGEIARLEQEIAKIEQFKADVADLIPDADKWLGKFSMADIQKAYDSVKDTLAKISIKTLAEQEKQLAIEVQYVVDPNYKKPHKIYPTWEIAQNAYSAKLAEVKDKIFWNDKTKQYYELLKFKTKSTKFKDAMDNASNAIMNKSKWTIDNALYEAEQIKMKLEQAALKRAAKKAQNGAPKITEVKFSAADLTQERKDKALWFIDPSDANDYFIENARRAWPLLTKKEKYAIWNYTEGSAYCTETLRGIDGWKYYPSRKSMSVVERDIEELTNALSKTAFKDDVWIKRDEIPAFMDYRFGINLESFKADAIEIGKIDKQIDSLQRKVKTDKAFGLPTDPDVFKQIADLEAERKKYKSLEGLEGIDESFVSCGDSKDTYFGRKPVVLNIYCPKGTLGTYVEPCSNFGTLGSKGYDWDGVTKPSYTCENEIILQRGTKFRITKAEFNEAEQRWYIDIDVLEQKPKEIIGYENSGGWFAKFKQ